MTLGERRRGIERLRPWDGVRARVIEASLAELYVLFASRVLSMDTAVAEEWGRLTAPRSRPEANSLLAATALVHGLVLVTRNVRDVEGLAVPVLNPFAAAGSPDTPPRNPRRPARTPPRRRRRAASTTESRARADPR